MERYRILIADDHALFRQGLQNILSERPDFEVVGQARDGLHLLELLGKVRPHAIVLDISMPYLRGIEAIHEVKRLIPDVKVLILTMHKDSEYLSQAVSAGADGYLLKDDVANDLFVAIDSIRRGEIFLSRLIAEEARQYWAQMLRGERSQAVTDPLTVREREVLKLIVEGRTSKEIGKLLFISYRTVERHRANIMEKLELKKTADLVRYAIQKCCF